MSLLDWPPFDLPPYEDEDDEVDPENDEDASDPGGEYCIEPWEIPPRVEPERPQLPAPPPPEPPKQKRPDPKKEPSRVIVIDLLA